MCETQSWYRASLLHHPLFVGWLISCKYWSLQGKEAVYSTLSVKVKRFIWVQVMKGGRRGEIWPGISYDWWDSDVWRSQWQKGREKIQARHSLEHSQQHLQVMYDARGRRGAVFPNWAVWCSHEQADLLYCQWCIIEQRRCKELWVIGFWFFLMEAKKLPPLSQQAGGSETEQIGIYTYIDYVPHPSKFCYSMFDFCCYNNTGIKITLSTSYI